MWRTECCPSVFFDVDVDRLCSPVVYFSSDFNFLPIMYCCQRCIRMLLGYVSVHLPRTGVTLPQQHLSIHTTTRKNVLSSHLILHGGRIQPRIPLVRSRVGTLQGLCDSAAVKISHQIKPSDNDDTLARNIVPYEQAQTTSRKPHLTEIPALLGEWTQLHFHTLHLV